MNYIAIMDFSKVPNSCEIKMVRSKSEAFEAIGTVENGHRNIAVEESTLEKPYLCKIADKRFGCIVPKNFHENPTEYVNAVMLKIEKKYNLTFKGEEGMYE